MCPIFSQLPVTNTINGIIICTTTPFYLVLPVDVKHTVTIKGGAIEIINKLPDSQIYLLIYFGNVFSGVRQWKY